MSKQDPLENNELALSFDGQSNSNYEIMTYFEIDNSFVHVLQ